MSTATLVETGPPCEVCRRPITDLEMASLVWGRFLTPRSEEVVFDGLHFFHKPCDPGPRVYAQTFGLRDVVESGESLFGHLAELIGVAAQPHKLSPEHWLNLFETVTWLVWLTGERALSEQGIDGELFGSVEAIARASRRLRIRVGAPLSAA